ncbi:GNAT family N-acetyltransferase [Shewanella gaetbuli]|uniref:GNAT family N-acetyltransferase n=1 Tax=Shewanella gaetbuli TaxID=220752 RepID=A0A9X1ZLV2_9GAMM|nr:GNAT family N-acetyltransferase [Shewanella gaetbuli]
MTAQIRLQAITQSDLVILHQFESDLIASKMAEFTPREWPDFVEHWQHNIFHKPDTIALGVKLESQLVGSVLSWRNPSDALTSNGRLIGYWIDRAYWGQGIASKALGMLLPQLPKEPLFAYIADHNTRSQNIVKRYGFASANLTKAQKQALPENLGLYCKAV